MAFQIKQEALLTPLKRVSGVVEQKQLIPALSHIKMIVGSKQITLITTDSKTELKSHAALHANHLEQEDFAITMPARKLNDIFRSLKNGSLITFEINQAGWVNLTCGQLSFKLATLPPESFPVIPFENPRLKFTLQESDLLMLLSKTCFAMADQDVRPFLNGMLIKIDKDKTSAIAMNGHRLAFNELAGLNKDVEKTESLLLPRKAVLELTRLLKDQEAPLTLSLTKHHCRIEAEEFTFTSSLIEAQYPDYKSALVDKNHTDVLIEKEAFKAILTHAHILAHEKSNEIYLELKEDHLYVKAQNEQQEVFEAHLKVQRKGEGEDHLKTRLNINYLIDVIQVLEGDHIRLSLSDPYSGIFLKETTPQHQSLFLIMPVHTS